MAEQVDLLPTLTVALATVEARLSQITLPPPVSGIDYLITVQPGLPPLLPDWQARSDVQICAEPSAGLSANRNAGLEQAVGALLLFCDDDIRLDPAGMAAMRAAFAADPDLVLALGWRSGRRPRAYALSRFNTGRAAVPEIVIRTQTVRAADIRFDTGFGIGAPWPLGEDYIFVTDVLAAGLRGQSLPYVTGTHDGPSSGDDWRDPALMRARAQVLRRVFGRWAVPIRWVYTWRHRTRFASGICALRFALWGR